MAEKFVSTLALNLTFSPPSSLRFDAIAPQPKAKADRRRNSNRSSLVLRVMVQPILSRKFSRGRRMILLLLGEKAAMRVDVKANSYHKHLRTGFSLMLRSFVVQWICERSGDRKTTATLA
jgi:hypothetical protein